MSVERDERVEVWIATGLRRPWRVVSITETLAEFEQLETAQAYLALLVEGRDDLKALT